MKSILIIAVLLPGCADFSLRNSFAASALGLGLGSLAGYGFSPNHESRLLNALIFGAVGGASGFLASKIISKTERSSPQKSLIQEEGTFAPEREISLPAATEVPKFLENRLTPLVLEEWTEKDSVSPDGSLNEPHHVWRIKRTPELIPETKHDAER